MESNWNSYQTDLETGSAEANRLTQQISSNIQKISQNVVAIERMVNQLGTAQDNEQLRTKLHDLEHDTKTLSVETKDQLAKFNSLPPSPNSDEERKFKLLRDRFFKEFSKILNDFQNIQRKTAQKEKASVIRAKYDAGEIQDGESAATGLPYQQRTQMEQQIDIQTLKDRQEKIVQLETDISDINQIFKDLALMVHDQGELIDSIEANVDSAQIHVQQGASQIAKAAEYQSKARRKKFICMIAFVVLLAILILIIYLSVR